MVVIVGPVKHGKTVAPRTSGGQTLVDVLKRRCPQSLNEMEVLIGNPHTQWTGCNPSEEYK